MTPPQTPTHDDEQVYPSSLQTAVTHLKRRRDSDAYAPSPAATTKRKFLLKPDLIESDKELMEIAYSIGSSWEEIGIQLGLSYASLQGISATYSAQGVNMMAFHMLQQWKQQATNGCSHQELSTALEEAGLNRAARKLCYEHYVTNGTNCR